VNTAALANKLFVYILKQTVSCGKGCRQDSGTFTFFTNGFKFSRWSRMVIPYGDKHRTNARTVTDNVFAKSSCFWSLRCSAPRENVGLASLCRFMFARRFETYLLRRKLMLGFFLPTEENTVSRVKSLLNINRWKSTSSR